MSNPIAVFDSGLGGLSVARHLRLALPHESIVYFGDTARVPYGIKSRPTVAHFALEIANYLLGFEPKLMVAACNTASALAMDELIEGLPVPVVGVVEPGAHAAVELADGGTIAVIGTEATIGCGAYRAAIERIAPGSPVIGRACPLFVPLVEEGRTSDDAIVHAVANEYLAPLRSQNVSVVVLGCTHYPLLREAIAQNLGPEVHIVDSGEQTARAVRATLENLGCLSQSEQPGTMRCYVSDNPRRFQQVGSRFLSQSIEHVEYVPPERYITTPIIPGQLR